MWDGGKGRGGGGRAGPPCPFLAHKRSVASRGASRAPRRQGQRWWAYLAALPAGRRDGGGVLHGEDGEGEKRGRGCENNVGSAPLFAFFFLSRPTPPPAPPHHHHHQPWAPSSLSCWPCAWSPARRPTVRGRERGSVIGRPRRGPLAPTPPAIDAAPPPRPSTRPPAPPHAPCAPGAGDRGGWRGLGPTGTCWIRKHAHPPPAVAVACGRRPPSAHPPTPAPPSGGAGKGARPGFWGRGGTAARGGVV